MDPEQDADVITVMEYKGRTVKIVTSQVAGDTVRFIDTSGLTDLSMLIVVAQHVLNKVDRYGSVALFALALQGLAVQMIEADLNNES